LIAVYSHYICYNVLVLVLWLNGPRSHALCWLFCHSMANVDATASVVGEMRLHRVRGGDASRLCHEAEQRRVCNVHMWSPFRYRQRLLRHRHCCRCHHRRSSRLHLHHHLPATPTTPPVATVSLSPGQRMATTATLSAEPRECGPAVPAPGSHNCATSPSWQLCCTAALMITTGSRTGQPCSGYMCHHCCVLPYACSNSTNAIRPRWHFIDACKRVLPRRRACSQAAR